MQINIHALTLAAAAVFGLSLAPTLVHAQVATTIEQAELAGLSPEKAAEVKARATNGNTVTEVLTTELLNGIKVKHPASSIVALDFGRGIAVIKTKAGKYDQVKFDTTTLAIKS